MSNIPFIPAAAPRTELPPTRPQTQRQRTGELVTQVDDPGEQGLAGIHGDQQHQQEKKKKQRHGQDPSASEEPQDIVELNSADAEAAPAPAAVASPRPPVPTPPQSSLDISA